MSEATFQWIMIGLFVVILLSFLVFAKMQYNEDKEELHKNLGKDKLSTLKDKQKKLFQKYEEKIKKVEQKSMPKENTQFTAYAMANERVKLLIETFSDQYEVDMHEWEKNLFALAYEKGYADGKFDYKQSLLKEDEDKKN